MKIIDYKDIDTVCAQFFPTITKFHFFHQSCIKPWSFQSDQDIPPKVKVSCLMRLLLLGCLWQCHSNSGNRRTSGCATKWFKGHKQGKKIKYRYTVNFKVKLTSLFMCNGASRRRLKKRTFQKQVSSEHYRENGNRCERKTLLQITL